MEITISISAEEVSSIINKLNLDPNKLVETLAHFNHSGRNVISDSSTPNNYSREMLDEWFDEVSWETFYLCHLILVHSKQKGQVDEKGCFLDSHQLEEFEISGRSSSSRVGGSRRVCKRINAIDILFIRNQKNRKLFYVSADAIEDIGRLLKDSDIDAEYREYLDTEKLTYPSM